MKFWNNRTGRSLFTLSAGLLTIATLSLAPIGCGNGDDGDGGSTITKKKTGTFYGANPIPIQTPSGGVVNLGNAYIKLENGVPLAVGFELAPAAVKAQPQTPITDDQPNIFQMALPPEAEITCFKQLMLFYFSAHPIDAYRPVGEGAHFHCLFLLAPQQVPSAGFVKELGYPNVDEIPPGVSRGIPDTILPGIGVNYDDPLKPAGVPPRITVGQNYFYYDGNMNAMVAGQNRSFLEAHETFEDSVPQPAKYPRVAYYPTHVSIRWNSSKKRHVFEFSQFIFIGEDKLTQ